MGRIITISREFASGGRELAKRMADLLGYDYYDREMIDAIAEERGLSADYLDKRLEQHEWRTAAVHYRRTFSSLARQRDTAELLVREKEVLLRIAASGKDCVIVGRNADVHLKEQEPFRLFVCADTCSRLLRCRERMEDQEGMTDRQILRSIRQIDKNRAATRELVAGNTWGDPASYHFIVNTTAWELSALSQVCAQLAKGWFDARAEGEPKNDPEEAFRVYGE